LLPALADLPDKGYQLYLECLFDELGTEVKVLFHRREPASLLWPRRQTLLDLIQILNRSELEGVWDQDETIGWVYQYFNSLEERRAMRDASAAPRNSRELAVRNQFFTPRYVVEFLTDNTLSRIWYEMREGATALKEQCHYLVRGSTEIFLHQGETAPEAAESPEVLSQEDLLKQPVYVLYRAKKDPRDLRTLDPACGSGHFLLYCFELLITIYLEAWHDAASPPSEITGRRLGDDYPSLEALKAAIPGLILKQNLHGIDIDPRCAQIAALALWMRAQRSFNDFGISRQERVEVDRTNIVVAEPMPGEKPLLEEFIATELSGSPEDRLVGQLIRHAFESMKLAGEAGSLLKIEEEISGAIAEAKRQWKLPPKYVQSSLFGDFPRSVHQEDFRFEVSGISEAEFWNELESRIYRALAHYAESAESGAYQRRLFAEDAARGFAFIDVCRTRYDVVIMNPPFGEPSATASEYVQVRYPTWNRNLLCAFLERSWEIIVPGGTTAAIFDRTAVVKSTYEDFRRAHLIPHDRILTVADLGWEVLDANVEVTTCVLSSASTKAVGFFFDVRTVPPEEKGSRLLRMIDDAHSGVSWDGTVAERSSRFAALPNAVIGYDFPAFLRSGFSRFPSLEAAGLKASQGHALKADKHFRLWWELKSRDQQAVFSRMFNGAGYSPYVTSLLDCVVSPVELEQLPKDTATVLRNSDKQGKSGVCFGKRGEYFCAHILPEGHIFTVEGQSIPVSDQSAALELVAYLNTPLIRFALNKYCGQHKYSGYVNLLPFASIRGASEARRLVVESVVAIQSAQRYDEVQSAFLGFPATQSIRELGRWLSSLIQRAWAAANACECFCNGELIQQLGVTQEEEEAVQTFHQGQPQKETAIEDAEVGDDCARYSAHSGVS